MSNVTATLTDAVTHYTDLGDWIGLAACGTGNPGATATPSGEASGGSPAYARKSTAWTVTGAVAMGTAVTFNVPAGVYTHMIFCSASSGNNMLDWAAIDPQTVTEQTTITITPLATAT